MLNVMVKKKKFILFFFFFDNSGNVGFSYKMGKTGVKKKKGKGRIEKSNVFQHRIRRD